MLLQYDTIVDLFLCSDGWMVGLLVFGHFRGVITFNGIRLGSLDVTSLMDLT